MKQLEAEPTWGSIGEAICNYDPRRYTLEQSVQIESCPPLQRQALCISRVELP
jgi:hypothetical protein